MLLYYWLAAQGIDPFARRAGRPCRPPRWWPACAPARSTAFAPASRGASAPCRMGVGVTLATTSRCGTTIRARCWARRPSSPSAIRTPASALVAARAGSRQMDRCVAASTARRRRDVLAEPAYLDTARRPDRAAPAWRSIEDGHGRELARPDALAFHPSGAVNFPYLSDGMWFMTQHKRWGLLRRTIRITGAWPGAVNRIDLYPRAARLAGTPAAQQRCCAARRLIDGVVLGRQRPGRLRRSFAIRIQSTLAWSRRHSPPLLQQRTALRASFSVLGAPQ